MRFVIIYTFCLSFLFSDEGFQWPIASYSFSEMIISSTFGESRKDHFHSGVDIKAEDLFVLPIQSGKILYLESRGMLPHRFAFGTGNLIILEHAKGIRSGYYHLKSFLLPVKTLFVDKNQSIAITGNTGRSSGAHLHFFIATDYGKKIINPLLFLKEKDSTPPLIEHIAFFVNQETTPPKITIILPEKESKIRLTRNYPVYLKVIDESTTGTRRLPFRIEWIFKNQLKEKKGKIEFEYIVYKNDIFYLNDKFLFNDLYLSEYLKLDEFPYENGINTLTVKAYDYNENTSEKKFILNIKKEY